MTVLLVHGKPAAVTAPCGDGPAWRPGSDIPRVDLAYTWRVPPMYPGAPGLANSAGSSCRAGEVQPCWSSNQVTVRPPRRCQPHLVAKAVTSPSPRRPSASPSAGRNSGTPGPLRSATSTRTMPPPALTATVTVSPGSPDRLYRTLLPKSSLTSRAATSPHGCPGRVPRRRTSGRPAPAPPARQASRSPEPPARPSAHPPFPVRPAQGNHRAAGGHTGMHARLSGARQAGTHRQHGASVAVRGRPWKSRRCIPTVLAAPTPSASVRGHRNTTVYSATR